MIANHTAVNKKMTVWVRLMLVRAATTPLTEVGSGTLQRMGDELSLYVFICINSSYVRLFRDRAQLGILLWYFTIFVKTSLSPIYKWKPWRTRPNDIPQLSLFAINTNSVFGWSFVCYVTGYCVFARCVFTHTHTSRQKLTVLYLYLLMSLSK